jgi:hypothetical protein
VKGLAAHGSAVIFLVAFHVVTLNLIFASLAGNHVGDSLNGSIHLTLEADAIHIVGCHAFQLDLPLLNGWQGI